MDESIVQDMQCESYDFFSSLQKICLEALKQDLREGKILLQPPAQNLQGDPASLSQHVASSEGVNSQSNI